MNMIKKTVFSVAFTFFCTVWAMPVSALTFPLPENGDNVVGEVQHIAALADDTFSRVARRYNVGYYQLVEANPKVDPNKIAEGTPLVIPTAFVLPAAPKKGMVINLAELRMYYYPPDGKTVETYPLGVGRDGWNTPLGVTRVTEKTKNPTWVPPVSIREHRKKEGVFLPAKVPPGVENPLGGYRMRLAIPTGAYLIHGTNNPSGVGRRSSSGCINMLPEDVEALFEKVPSGTPVRIINDPYKVGQLSGKLFLEAHEPLEEQKISMVKVVTSAKKSSAVHVNWELADTITRAKKGIPEPISLADVVT